MNRPEVHDVLRRWRELADAAAPPRVLVGETYVLELDQLIPFYGTGEDELNLAFNFLFVHADARRGSAAHDRRGGGGEAARRRVAGLHRLQPRRRPAGHALGGGRPAARPRRAADAADAARHAVPLLRRRARAARGRDRLAHRARPRRAAHRGPVAQPRPLPHADAVDAARRAAGSRRTASRRGCRSATSPCNVEDQRADPGSTLHLVRDLIALRRAQADLAHGRVRDAAGAGRRVGVAARRRLRRRGQPVGRAGRRSPVRRGGSRSAPTGRVTARPWTGRSRSARGRRRWCSDDRRARPAALRRGLAVRVAAAAGARRPRPLPRALRPRLAHHRAPGPARGAGGRARHAARARRAPGRRRRPGDRRGAGQDPARVPARGARLLRRARLAGARRRAPLLRHGGRDELVPDRARRARRRRARRGARAGMARGGRLARAERSTRAAATSATDRARSAGRPGAAGLARRDGAGRGASARRRHPARRTAPSRSRRSRTPTARPRPSRRSTRSGGSTPAAGGPRAPPRCAATSPRGVPDVLAVEADGTPVPGAGSSLGWLLWAGALEGDAAAAAADRLARAGRPDRLRPADARGERRRVQPARLSPRRRVAVRLLAGLGRAARRRAGRRRPSASAPACSPRSTGWAGPRSSTPSPRTACSSRSPWPTACRPGRSAPAGRSSSAGTDAWLTPPPTVGIVLGCPKELGSP